MGESFKLSPFSDNKSLSLQTKIQIQPGVLLLSFLLSSIDGLDGIKIPKFQKVLRKDKLWESTCFECFLFFPEQDYFELNISPTGEWNSFYFTSYRKGMATTDKIDLTQLTTSNDNKCFCVESSFEYKEQRYPDKIQMSAVIEMLNGEKQYWAIEHPPSNADFHLKSIAHTYRWS